MSEVLVSPYCWRCLTEKDLHKHSTTRAGRVRHLCRSCRRALYRNYKERHGIPVKSQVDKPSDEWQQKAKDSYDRIMRRFA